MKTIIEKIRVLLEEREALSQHINHVEEILHEYELCQLGKDSLDRQIELSEELGNVYLQMIENEGKLQGYENAFRLIGKENTEPEKEEKPLKTARQIYEHVLKP